MEAFKATLEELSFADLLLHIIDASNPEWREQAQVCLLYTSASGDEAKEGEPRKRVLSRNFRSRPQVLEGCNDLFRNIMSTQLGELDYTDDQALVPGAEFPEDGDYALELNALDLSYLGDQEGEKEDKNRLEARFVARHIRALLEEPLMVKEGDGGRPLRPSDVDVYKRQV